MMKRERADRYRIYVRPDGGILAPHPMRLKDHYMLSKYFRSLSKERRGQVCIASTLFEQPWFVFVSI